MKTLLFGTLALVIGLGGGAYLSGAKVRDRLVAEAAQAAADSDAAAAAAHAEPGMGDAGPGSEVGWAASPDMAGAQGAAPDVETVASVERAVEEQRVDDSIAAANAEIERRRAEEAQLADEGARKLSKIFGAMQAPDAAAVLQEMSDEEIELILTHMSDRLAAQILGVFEPARAAALTRAVLGSRRTGS